MSEEKAGLKELQRIFGKEYITGEVERIPRDASSSYVGKSAYVLRITPGRKLSDKMRKGIKDEVSMISDATKINELFQQSGILEVAGEVIRNPETKKADIKIYFVEEIMEKPETVAKLQRIPAQDVQRIFQGEALNAEATPREMRREANIIKDRFNALPGVKWVIKGEGDDATIQTIQPVEKPASVVYFIAEALGVELRMPPKGAGMVTVPLSALMDLSDAAWNQFSQLRTKNTKLPECLAPSSPQRG